jgi:hypothetical protein
MFTESLSQTFTTIRTWSVSQLTPLNDRMPIILERYLLPIETFSDHVSSNHKSNCIYVSRCENLENYIFWSCKVYSSKPIIMSNFLEILIPMVCKYLLSLILHWNLLTKCSCCTWKIDQIYALIPRKRCPLYHFYLHRTYTFRTISRQHSQGKTKFAHKVSIAWFLVKKFVENVVQHMSWDA